MTTQYRGSERRSATTDHPRLIRSVRSIAFGIGLFASTASVLTSASGASATKVAEPSGSISLVAYSTPQPAYARLIAAFNKTPAGRNVNVSQSFGPSGSQAKAVIAGQQADVVNFASATDVETLVAKNLVPTDWAANATTKGMVTDSIVVFVTPKGNPEHIKTWSDLIKPGIRIFTPNPFSSGSARWNIMAAYGAQLKLGATPAAAQAYLKSLLEATVVQGTSAAVELQDFLADEGSNEGDVFLDYESDAIQAQQAGTKLSYVVPKQTILIENPIAVTTNSPNPTAAVAFESYLLSTVGQKLWAKLGYRPVLPAVASETRKDFPHPAQLFTIESLGGWDLVNNQFFSTSTSSPGIVTQIESGLGQTT